MKVIPVMSGKGGVGKTLSSINIAYGIASKGKKVGLVDMDIDGSNVPRVLNMPRIEPKVGAKKVEPFDYHGVKVMALGNITPSDDQPVMVRGEKKRRFVVKLINEVNWGKLDYFILDMPPGSGDVVIELLDLYKDKVHGTVIVTTPSRVTNTDVRKTIVMCNKIGIKIFGIVNNMNIVSCPNCKYEFPAFGQDGHIEKLKKDFGVEILADIPVTPEVELKPFSIAKYYEPIVNKLIEKQGLFF